MLRAALAGKLDDVETREDPVFGLRIPTGCPDVPPEVLDADVTAPVPESEAMVQAVVGVYRSDEAAMLVTDTAGMIPLPEAELVVSAGRGMKDPKNWGIVEDLAKAIGASPGDMILILAGAEERTRKAISELRLELGESAGLRKPDEFKYASSGVGSTQHIAGEGFDIAAGVKSIHIPYKGSSQAHLDLIAGNVQLMFDTTSSAMAQIKAGKFKPLAVTTSQRSAELPNVPTLAEAGVTGFEMSTWYGVFVTSGTPPEVVAKLQNEVAKIIKLPDVQAKLKGLGGEPGSLSVEQFTQLNRQEFERFGKLIRQANIKMQ